ncbi:SpoIIE family protein phosphatase [Sporomusa sp.]|uniref:SpoIIE family protein phosphatase n=1 Tax=Sporomusa sp. TaxID=2078658 RepID=UPI002B738285|nr:SpoIIE family protein phosphatase [Sporomusa sp.]HWR45427.1 SpoIIE family protein phosphatase [Sporomusa sp.]
MQRLHAEVGLAQLSKVGEELCGDNVDIVRTPEATIIVMSDGLGSGVKANILATLTTKIASVMLKRGIPLEDVVNTIAETLPVCRQRKIAYSTLHIIKIAPDGQTTVVEFDCPATFLVRCGKVLQFPTHEKVVSGKTIREGELWLQEDDILVAVTDGVLHAGIGGLLKLGWGWKGVAGQIESECNETSDAETIGQHLINCCEGYYVGRPGDDSTALVVKMRYPQQLTLFTGPPADSARDGEYVQRLLSESGKKVVSGGTTAQIVSKVTNCPLKVDLTCHDPHIPPIGYIDGIDLVTEGVLTLNAAVDRLTATNLRNSNKQDGATLLAKLLLAADKIKVLAGLAVNPAHQNPSFPMQMNIKAQVLNKLKTVLEDKGKQVIIEWI